MSESLKFLHLPLVGKPMISVREFGVQRKIWFERILPM